MKSSFNADNFVRYEYFWYHKFCRNSIIVLVLQKPKNTQNIKPKTMNYSSLVRPDLSISIQFSNCGHLSTRVLPTRSIISSYQYISLHKHTIISYFKTSEPHNSFQTSFRTNPQTRGRVPSHHNCSEYSETAINRVQRPHCRPYSRSS